jgi:polysaccharide biosynthesis protein PelC
MAELVKLRRVLWRLATTLGMTLGLTLGLSACASAPVQSSGSFRLAAADQIAMLPAVNNTDVPQATLRAESILQAALRARGLMDLAIYPPELSAQTLFEPTERKVQAQSEVWAKQRGIRYVVLVEVNEWRYKVGVDGEPAVGLVMSIKDITNGQVVYSAHAARAGSSRESLAALAQKLALELVSPLQFEQRTPSSAKP